MLSAPQSASPIGGDSVERCAHTPHPAALEWHPAGKGRECHRSDANGDMQSCRIGRWKGTDAIQAGVCLGISGVGSKWKEGEGRVVVLMHTYLLQLCAC